ncbi:hypothetical protein [Curtobacterium sp. MCBD17_019]|uniref:hypothetical protein n=1 Tax=Curtobacterium sp. MCBD17_019 TaxID=2175669 RepID=UPI0015E8C7DC|nr:hypothetical protein [Curtobacterium sp. MCBD17_019]
MIDGVVSRRVLRGRTVQRLLPDLLPLIDGTRTWHELAAAVEVPEATIRQVLGILYSAGLLEDGAAAAPGTGSSLLDFLSRTVDATRYHRSGHEAAAALRSGVVAVLCDDDDLGDAVRTALRSSEVPVGSPHEVVESAQGLIVALSTGSRTQASDRLAAYRDVGIPVLPVTLQPGTATLGPVSYPDHNPCPDCTSHGLRGTGRGSGGVSRDGGLHVRDLLPAFIAHEVVLLLAGVGTARTISEAIVMDEAPLRTSFEFVTRRPGCVSCGTGGTETGSSAFAYEESVAFPPARLTKPRTHQQHFEPANIALSMEQRHHDGLRLALPADVDAGHDTSVAAAVAQTLATAFALKPPAFAPEGKVRRWSPTGGNLGSPQAYFTTRGVPGLPDGRWMYRGDEYAAYRVAEPGAGPSGVELVIVAELYRVWKKYNTFAYRIAALDAGVALSHVAIAAAVLGLPVRNEFGWNAIQLERDYLLDANEQMVVGMVRIGSPS